MEIIKNMLIEFLDEEREQPLIMRVLHIYPTHKILCIDINGSSKSIHTKIYSREELEAKFQEAEIRVIQMDPFADLIRRSDDQLTDKQISAREHNYELLEPILTADEGIAIYYPKRRAKLIREVHIRSGVSRSYIYKMLSKWFKRGQVKNTLVPDYHRQGARGKRKPDSNVKRGRPRNLPSDSRKKSKAGINISEIDRKKIVRGMTKYHVKHGMSLQRSYEKMLADEYIEGYRYTDGIAEPILLPPEQMPTYDQARYWYQSERDVEKEKKIRLGRKYPLKNRPIVGDRFMIAKEPGAQFAADAANVGIYLVDPFNPEAVVGKPKIVFITDTYSGMIVGFAVTHENESWMTYLLALENALSDKVDFCKMYDIEILGEEWPCHHAPTRLLADRGPVEGKNADQLLHLGIAIENTPPYRPDLKGQVERKFRQFKDEIFSDPKLPGVTQPRERGGRDFVYEARLTLFELTKVIIYFILWHNKHWRMKEYPLNRAMTSDGVQPYPIQVWNWGIRNRSGQLRILDPRIARYRLLPEATASVYRKGISFNGLHYRSEYVERNKWDIRDDGRKQQKVRINYDPRTVDYIYVHDEARQEVHVCELSIRQESQRFKGCSWDEVKIVRRNERESERKALPKDVEKKAYRDNITAAIFKKAQKRGDIATQGMSKSARKKGITENHQDAVRAERESRLRDEAVPAPSDQPVPTPDAEDGPISAPSLPTNESGNYIPPRRHTDLIKRKSKKSHTEGESDNEE